MRLIAANIRTTRLQRLLKWALLWCVRLVLALAEQDVIPRWAEVKVRRALRAMARNVAIVIFLAAVRRCGRPRVLRRWNGTLPGFRQRRSRLGPGALRRALLGAALRKRLRGASLTDHAGAILRVLNGVEETIATLAARLARGMTRILPLIATAPAETRFTHEVSVAIASADTS